MSKKKISEDAKLLTALAANRVRPLLDAIVRLETAAKDRIIDDTEFIPEMEELSETAYDALIENAYQKALNKAKRLWLDDDSVSRDEDKIREQLGQLS